MSADRLIVTLQQASDLTPYSVATLRKAVLSDGSSWPPPLPAKRDSKGRITVKTADLLAWHDRMADA